MPRKWTFRSMWLIMRKKSKKGKIKKIDGRLLLVLVAR